MIDKLATTTMIDRNTLFLRLPKIEFVLIRSVTVFNQAQAIKGAAETSCKVVVYLKSSLIVLNVVSVIDGLQSA
jgi:hypothetical protein